MSHSLKTRAEVLSEAVKLGHIGVEDVIAWIDGVIDAEESPDPALFEATVAGSDKNKLTEALSLVRGTADVQGVARLLVGHMRNALLRDPTVEDRVVYSLFVLATDDRLPAADASGAMLWFYDALDLAREGSFGTLVEVREKLHEFLDRYGDT